MFVKQLITNFQFQFTNSLLINNLNFVGTSSMSTNIAWACNKFKTCFVKVHKKMIFTGTTWNKMCGVELICIEVLVGAISTKLKLLAVSPKVNVILLKVSSGESVLNLLQRLQKSAKKVWT